MSDRPDSTGEGRGRERRSSRHRKPLVIEGKARRLDDGRARNAAHAPLSASRSRPGPNLLGQARHQPASASTERSASTFFRRATNADADLFRHDGQHLNDASNEAASGGPSSFAPLKIAIVAGIALAALFILPSLFGLAGGARTVSVETSSQDASLGAGLFVSNVRADVALRDGASILTLSGDVANGSSAGIVPPPIEIVLTDGEGGRIVRRIEVTRRMLSSGERIAFSSSVLMSADRADRFALTIRPASEVSAP